MSRNPISDCNNSRFCRLLYLAFSSRSMKFSPLRSLTAAFLSEAFLFLLIVVISTAPRPSCSWSYFAFIRRNCAGVTPCLSNFWAIVFSSLPLSRSVITIFITCSSDTDCAATHWNERSNAKRKTIFFVIIKTFFRKLCKSPW